MTNARSSSFALATLPVAISVLLMAGAARADDAADTATARALGVDGVTLADAGKCGEAIEKLERAEKLHHAPTTATRLGECEIEAGKLVLGTERLQRVIREPLAANAHPAFVAAVARAQKALDKTLPRIATIRIAVNAPPGAKLAMTIDGEAVSEAAVGTERHIDPGTHTIQVRADGYLPASVRASLSEREKKNVSLELRPDPSWRASTDNGEAAVVTSGEAPSKVPAIIAFGVGAVGLGIGIYGATVVAEKASVLSSRCDDNRVCSPELQSEISGAKTWATVSTAGFIGAGVGVATGLVLLLASGGSSSTPKTGIRVRPSVGLTSVGVDGAF
jgi:hypothetical protein